MLAASVAGIVLLEPYLLKLICVVPLTMAILQASFLSHDLGHRQVFKTVRNNDRVLLVLSLFIGASRGWWIDTHNQHHDFPNDAERDPNLRVPFLAFTREQAGAYSGFMRALMRFQGLYFWGFVLLEGLAMKVHSARYLLRTPSASYRNVELLLMAGHVLLYAALVATTMPPLQALGFVVLQHALNGLYIGLVFAPNHKGMPLLSDVEGEGFLTQQVVTTRNVRDFFLANWLVGGLHYQIEHHLFTNLPRNRLRETRLIVKPYCEERAISYVETGLFESYAQVSRNFTEIAK
jgi:fatty acid desaturase